MSTRSHLNFIVALIVGASVASAGTGAQEVPSPSGTSACAERAASATDGSCIDAVVLPGPYIVFFPWGEMGVDEDGRMIVDEAAAAFADGLFITLSGHSDRSGPAAVNRRISERRAEAVRKALVKRGVPAEAIRIQVQGESALLIGTSDGVREAQNRRVEILFSDAQD